MTLAEFLLARLAEDEATVIDLDCACRDGEPQRPDCADRVLADVEAKRRIVQWHPLVSGEGEDGETVWGCANCIGASDGPGGPSFTIAGPCMTLRLLVLPFASHPDYQQEWALG